MLTDYDIRTKLIEKLHKENLNKSYRVIEELAICDGSARADVAVANGKFHGYEIKSDHDSLERLKNQIIYYDFTFDKNTIVVGEKFKEKILNHIPLHWGIEYAYLNRFGKVSLKKLRSPKVNKNVQASNLLDLLWGPELKMLLKNNKIKGYSNKNKEGLKKMTITSVPFNFLKDYTRETLKTRSGWREDLQ